MNLSSLTPAKGSVKSDKRIARGTGSGKGGTATRGHKGAKSRSGYSRKLGFEGGQMPLYRRVPKFGFKNKFRIEYKAVNLNVLQQISEKYSVDSIDQTLLIEKGVVAKNDKIKILGSGELTIKLSIKAHAISESAKAKVESAGGSFEII